MLLIKNKKGDVPVTILVLGVIAICTLAIISFVFSNKNQEIQSIGAMEKMRSQIEVYRFYSKFHNELGKKPQDLSFVYYDSLNKEYYMESKAKGVVIKFPVRSVP